MYNFLYFTTLTALYLPVGHRVSAKNFLSFSSTIFTAKLDLKTLFTPKTVQLLGTPYKRFHYRLRYNLLSCLKKLSFCFYKNLTDASFYENCKIANVSSHINTLNYDVLKTRSNTFYSVLVCGIFMMGIAKSKVF